MRGIFDADLFGAAGLGDLPSGAAALSELARWRGMFPGLPSDERLREQRVTAFTTEVISPSQQRFNFYTAAGQRVWQSTQQHRLMPESVQPAKTTPSTPALAPSPGDGLLPRETAPPPPGTPRWVPWVLVGGGLIVAGGIIVAGTRRKRVSANRRRRRSTTRRRR